MKKIRKLAALLLTLAMALGLAACSNSGEGSQNSSAPASQPAGEESAAPAGEGGSGEAMDPSQVKVALLLPGTITDAGWSAAAYNGLMEAQETFGIQVDYAESVALTEQETTMRDYAAQGYNLIICHGDEFADAASTVADEFPDVSFAVTNAVLSKPNAIGMDVKNEEQGYIAGYALGLLTKTNKVGFVGSQELASQLRVQAGFEEGLAAANPDAVASISYVGSMDDTTKAKEQALALFEQGCDTIFQYAQGAGIGVVQAAAEQGVTMVVTSPSQAEMNPDHTAFAVQTDMKANIVEVIDQYIQGNFNEDLSIMGTFATGLFQINSVDNDVIPEDVMAQVQAQVDAMIDGSLDLETRTFDS